MRSVTTTGLAALGILVLSSSALAADPVLTCRTGKLGVAGKYGSCRLAAEAKALKQSASPDYLKCESAFSTKWQAAEAKATKAMSACLDAGNESDIEGRIQSHADAIAALIAGGTVIECGNGVADGNDQCDGSDLDGQTCAGLGFTLGGTLACTAGCGFDTSACETEHLPATGQTTSYGTGDDGDVEAGATLSYTDNGDGTITDNNTGLMWEKKVQYTGGYTPCTSETGTCANPHNADNVYAWTVNSPPYTAYNGTVKTIFLNQLNNRCNNNTAISCTTNADCSVPGGACGFAGHRDWRLPNIKELVGLIDYSIPYPGPAVAAAFDGASCGVGCVDFTNPACSCDAASDYWSASTYASDPTGAWYVYTSNGFAFFNFKTNDLYVRAVRAGS